MKIPEITINPFEAFGNPEMEIAYEAQENAVNDAWKAVYSSVLNESYNIAYWDEKPVERPGYYSFMRYALHKSPRGEADLQLSVMEIRNGETIPTSHALFDCVDDFLHRSISFNGTVVNFLSL